MNNYFELSDEQKRFVLHNAEERIQEMIQDEPEIVVLNPSEL